METTAVHSWSVVANIVDNVIRRDKGQKNSKIQKLNLHLQKQGDPTDSNKSKMYTKVERSKESRTEIKSINPWKNKWIQSGKSWRLFGEEEGAEIHKSRDGHRRLWKAKDPKILKNRKDVQKGEEELGTSMVIETRLSVDAYQWVLGIPRCPVSRLRE